MAKKRYHLLGQKFGRLTVVAVDTDRSGCWLCECNCEDRKRVSVRAGRLVTGHTTSCGCWNRITARNRRLRHGMSRTRVYNIWRGMIQRCHNPRAESYSNYGGRGIQVCQDWKRSFERFWDDMKIGYAENLTLERRDVNLGYTKSNCCWILKSDQPRNSRRNRWIKTPEGKMLARDAASRYGINEGVLYARIKNGWPTEDLLLPANSIRHTR